MEYKELALLWKQYDERLDKLEKINKELLNETLLQKPKKRMRKLEFNIVVSLFAPLFVFILFRSDFKTESMSWNFITGWILFLLSMLFLCFRNLRFYLIFKKIKLNSDTAIQSLEKITRLKAASNNFRKHFFLFYPVLFSGFLLIIWNKMVFNASAIVLLIISFIAIYCIGAMNVGSHYKETISELEKEIGELKEYIEG